MPDVMDAPLADAIKRLRDELMRAADRSSLQLLRPKAALQGFPLVTPRRSRFVRTFNPRAIRHRESVVSPNLQGEWALVRVRCPNPRIDRKSREFKRSAKVGGATRFRATMTRTRVPASVGALVRQAGGRWFEPSTAHLGTRRKWRVSLCRVICSASHSL